MSSRGATWRGKRHYNKAKAINSRKGQRNRRHDDYFQLEAGMSSMSYEELQHHVKTCRSKQAHKSRGAAYRAKLEYEKEYGLEYHIYECPICGRFHLTTHMWEGGGSCD